MNCFICGETTDERLLCKNHRNTRKPLRYLSTDPCLSFKQKEGAGNGVCEHFLLRTPIRKALQKETLFTDLGHKPCLYASINLTQLVYTKFT